MLTEEIQNTVLWNSILIGHNTAHKIQKLEQESLDFLVEQLIWKDDYTRDEAQTGVVEYRKWVTMMILAGDKVFTQTYFGKDSVNLAMTSKLVDEVWHKHILFTKPYQEFCLRVNDEILHHYPTTQDTYKSSAASYTEDFYEIIYGPMPKLWSGNIVKSEEDGTESHSCHSCHKCHGCSISASVKSTCHHACSVNG